MKSVISKTCGRVCPLVKSLRDEINDRENLLNQLSDIIEDLRADHADVVRRNEFLREDLKEIAEAKQDLQKRIDKIRSCCFEGAE